MRPGVQLREYGNGKRVFYAYTRSNRMYVHLGSFPTEAEAARAVTEGLRSKRDKTSEERNIERAFASLRKCPQAWHLRGLTYAEQVERVMLLPQSIRLLILRFVPVEDDPIFCVAMDDPDGTNLAGMARLYGCTREYMRQIGDKATEKIERMDGLDAYRDHTRRVTAWEEMG